MVQFLRPLVGALSIRRRASSALKGQLTDGAALADAPPNQAAVPSASSTQTWVARKQPTPSDRCRCDQRYIPWLDTLPKLILRYRSMEWAAPMQIHGGAQTIPHWALYSRPTDRPLFQPAIRLLRSPWKPRSPLRLTAHSILSAYISGTRLRPYPHSPRSNVTSRQTRGRNIQIEDVASWSTIGFFLSQYLRYQHSLLPLVHRPTFTRALAMRQDKDDVDFRAFLLGLGGYVDWLRRLRKLMLGHSSGLHDRPVPDHASSAIHATSSARPHTK